VLPGSTKTFYGMRMTMALTGCIAAIACAGATYWIVDRVVLAPATPTPSSPADVWLAYVVEPRGMARLKPEQATRYLEHLLVRLLSDEAFRNAFASGLRSGAAEEQGAFREHVFDAFKPKLMADIRRYDELKDDAARTVFLDERLLDFKRMELLTGGSKIDKSFADAAGGQAELIKLLLAKTTEEERSLGAAYIRAAVERWNEIKQDEAKRADFEKRLKGQP
jgi:hypothetical protein